MTIIALNIKKQWPSSGVYGLGQPHDPGSFFLNVQEIIAMIDKGTLINTNSIDETKHLYPYRKVDISNISSERDALLLVKHGIFEIFEYMRMLDHSISRVNLALNLM